MSYVTGTEQHALRTRYVVLEHIASGKLITVLEQLQVLILLVAIYSILVLTTQYSSRCSGRPKLY
jgi:hypothetical protein